MRVNGADRVFEINCDRAARANVSRKQTCSFIVLYVSNEPLCQNIGADHAFENDLYGATCFKNFFVVATCNRLMTFDDIITCVLSGIE